MEHEDNYLHGICQSTGFVKHWPKKSYYAKDGFVYKKGTNRVLGRHDNSVLTEESRQVIRERDGQNQEPPVEANTPQSEVQATESQQCDEESSATPEAETTPSPIESEKEIIMTNENNNAQNAANNEAAVESETTSTTTSKESTMNEKQTTKAEAAAAAAELAEAKAKPMSTIGYYFRLVSYFVLAIAATVVLGFSGGYAITWLATLGLSTLMLNILTFAIYFVTVGVCYFAGGFFGKLIAKLGVKRDIEVRAAVAAAV